MPAVPPRLPAFALNARYGSLRDARASYAMFDESRRRVCSSAFDASGLLQRKDIDE